MHSFGLALTLTLLTSTLVVLDLSDTHPGSSETIVVDSPRSLPNDSVSALSIMPNSLPGRFVPKADISNGVFAVGSSTGNEGLNDDEHDDEHDVGTHANAVDDESDPADAETDEGNDFVLI